MVDRKKEGKIRIGKYRKSIREEKRKKGKARKHQEEVIIGK